MDVGGKSRPHRDSITGPSSPQRVAIPTGLSRPIHFPRYHMKILLGDFNAIVRSENIFKPTIGNESLHQDSNDNGVRIVNLPHQKCSC